MLHDKQLALYWIWSPSRPREGLLFLWDLSFRMLSVCCRVVGLFLPPSLSLGRLHCCHLFWPVAGGTQNNQEIQGEELDKWGRLESNFKSLRNKRIKKKIGSYQPLLCVASLPACGRLSDPLFHTACASCFQLGSLVSLGSQKIGQDG